jgi:hypothetical protein
MNRLQILNNAALAAGLLLLLPQPAANAAEITSSKYSDGSYYIRVSGRINAGDQGTFAVMANSIPKGAKTEVVLASNGGNIGGLDIGRIIHQRKFGTVAYGKCLSMCATIWLAGTPRAMAPNSYVGFHAAGDHCVDSVCQNVSAVGNALIGAYLNELGFPAVTIMYVVSAAPNSLMWMTKDISQMYNIPYTQLGAGERLEQK